MHKILIVAALSVLFACIIPITANADVNIGISADQDGIKEFHLSIGAYYGVKEREIERVGARSLPDDEMTVVFFISNRAAVSPLEIADLRLKGLSWMDITYKYWLTSEVYYVRFASDPGPPYGKAWGNFKKRPKKKWHEIKLADADIVNLVNLKFLAEKYNCSPEKIVRMKKQGKSFANMNGEFKKAKAQKKQKKAKVQKTAKSKPKGKRGRK